MAGGAVWPTVVSLSKARPPCLREEESAAANLYAYRIFKQTDPRIAHGMERISVDERPISERKTDLIESLGERLASLRKTAGCWRSGSSNPRPSDRSLGCWTLSSSARSSSSA
jgi:hypothetical protein